MLKIILITPAIVTTLALGACLCLLDTPVKADGYYSQHHKSYVNRIVYRKHKTRLYRELDDRRIPQKEHCLGPVRGVGTQWVGEEGAMDAARKDWAERVRYDHGEIFIDMNHAIDFEKRCGRTSIGQIAGQVLYRCEVVARPCKAEFEKQEGQK